MGPLALSAAMSVAHVVATGLPTQGVCLVGPMVKRKVFFFFFSGLSAPTWAICLLSPFFFFLRGDHSGIHRINLHGAGCIGGVQGQLAAGCQVFRTLSSVPSTKWLSKSCAPTTEGVTAVSRVLWLRAGSEN